MKKLKLETLEVTSFETSPSIDALRGTVNGNSSIQPSPGTVVGLETYNVQECGDTRYFDCTYGCSVNTACPNGCIDP